jgi:arylsulfatase A-like enzyme
LKENTVVILTSDNGAVEHTSDNSPFRRGKGHLYEGGIRIPLIIRWPEHIRGGSVSLNPTISEDIYSTIIEIVKKGALMTNQLDGRSLMKDFAETGTIDHDLFWYYPHYSPQAKMPGVAIRSGNYKLIRFYDPPTVELYNLKNDIGETTNLAKSEPKKVKQLSTKIDQWLNDSGTILHKSNPNHSTKK